MSEAEVLAMLRRHYLPPNRAPGGFFLPQVTSPDETRRADLLWVPTTIAGGRRTIVGHEVKCDRGDLRRELSEPAKADPWAQYCDYWWLVVSDPALLEGEQIPEAWGIMAPPSGRRTVSMTIVRHAPALEPRSKEEAWRALARHLGYRNADLEGRYRAASDELVRQMKRAEDLRAQTPEVRSLTHKRVEEILEHLRKRERGDHWLFGAKAEEIAEAIADLERARNLARAILNAAEGAVRSFERAVDPFGERLLGELSKAAAAARRELREAEA